MNVEVGGRFGCWQLSGTDHLQALSRGSVEPPCPTFAKAIKRLSANTRPLPAGDKGVKSPLSFWNLGRKRRKGDWRPLSPGPKCARVLQRRASYRGILPRAEALRGTSLLRVRSASFGASVKSGPPRLEEQRGIAPPWRNVRREALQGAGTRNRDSVLHERLHQRPPFPLVVAEIVADLALHRRAAIEAEIGYRVRDFHAGRRAEGSFSFGRCGNPNLRKTSAKRQYFAHRSA